VNVLAALAFALFGIHVGAHRVLPIGYAPAWSPDGQRIAFVTRGSLWVADADGTDAGRLTGSADQPAWSPNGRRLAFTRAGSIWTIRVDGLDERRLAAGAHPAWSPDGSRLAFDRAGEVITVRWSGGGARLAGSGEDPAYGPNGQLAVVRDGQIVVDGDAVGTAPSPRGRRRGSSPGRAATRSTSTAAPYMRDSSPRGARPTACRSCCRTSTSAHRAI
jgi:dipeptidyl aminopeptidase/acylaminoacyl peptidase